MTRRAALALAALAAILAVTAAWWTLALWPASPTVPAWVERTRAVCFGVAPGGLPSGAGWLSLVGEPVGMLGFLLVVWGDAVREGIRALRRSWGGRLALAGAGALLLVGLAAVGARVRGAGAGARFDARAGAGDPVRVDRAPPPLALVDQHGDTVRLAQFRGRPVVVAFAYAHCETVCPAIVHDVTRAVAEARERRPVLLVVTLDPWRDTPARLPHLAAEWQLPGEGRVLGGDVGAVTRVLDAWGVSRARDAATGEIVHASSVYVLGPEGRIAFVATGPAPRLGELLRRL